ncbi:MAG: response regulator [Bdellovibrionales bacterium]|nr:response regulator [Bdellovibrionales bacterium]
MVEDFKGVRILIVDDEPDLREILCDGFALRGAEVASASNAEQALEALRLQEFDLVISDVRMPKGGGMRILEGLPELGKTHLPVVLVTGFSDVSENDALQKGAKIMIAKPFDFATLYDTAKKFIRPAR